MTNYPLPPNEKQRLKELHLYKILDTVSEQEFNRITKIASEICDTPVSLMTLLDEHRQWIKSSHGYPIVETPREISFCNYTILDPSTVLEVPDLRKDERFSGNPLVTNDPHVVFYAGAPLITPSGCVLGSICVLDTREKRLNESQREALVALSQQVMNSLDLRKTIRTLKNTQSKLKRANHNLKSFAEIISHDLKTPIANISMLTKVLEKEHVKGCEDMGEIVHLIGRSSQSMLCFIDNVLKRSKSSNTPDNTHRAVRVDRVIQDVVEMIAPAEDVKINISRPLPTVKVDHSLLVQVFHNLISNAIKYNDKKQPEISIESYTQSDRHTFVVADNGQGIAEKNLKTVFKNRTVCQDVDRFGNRGTGHGLYNVKQLLEEIGGKIEVSSIEGEGSRFTFHLPACRA